MTTEKTTKADTMNKETLAYFLLGLKHFIKDSGLTQDAVAIKADTTGVTMSKYINGRGAPSKKWRDKVVAALNTDETELVLIGRKIQNQPFDESPSPQPPTFPAPVSDILQADEATQALSTVSQSFLKIDAKLKYWVQAFDSLPVPVIIVRDGVVYSQNRKSRALWAGIGHHLCDGCNDPTCSELGCDIKTAIDKGLDVEKYKMIGEDYYKVETSHFVANSYHYTAVVITKINECRTATESLDAIRAERAFLASNPYELPEYYANADRKVSYVNDAFLELFDIQRDDMQTADDFHIMISKKLFYFGHVSQAADIVRSNGKPADVAAKLKNNKTVHFLFRPHLRENGDLAGVLVVVLTPEMYELHQEKKDE